MGLFDAFTSGSKASDDSLISWMGASADELVWRFPSDELGTWSQLIVNESQEAFLVRGGVYEGPFGAGRHTLTTENIPVLSKLIGLPFGKRSPFRAEVWFVNKIVNLNIRWGTPDPIQLQDPKFLTMIPVRGFGQYGVRISNAKQLLLKLVGTQRDLSAEKLKEYFRGVFITRIKTQIAKAIVERGISVLEVSTQLETLSLDLREALKPYLDEFGLELVFFDINSINIPEDDPAVAQLKSALAKRAEMNIVGYNYQQERSFDVMNAAASNEGNAGSVMGAGLGLGMGVSMGGPIGNAFGQIAPNLHTGSGNLQLSASSGEVPQAAEKPAAPQAPPNSTRISPETRLQLLKELAELRASGILSDEEFQSEKQKILNQ